MNSPNRPNSIHFARYELGLFHWIKFCTITVDNFVSKLGRKGKVLDF